MWGYYGDSHKGYCIGFKTQSLKNLIAIHPLPVEYVSEYPNIQPSEDPNSIDDYLCLMRSKSDSWKHEKEWRFIKQDLGNKKVYYNSDDVEEIVLGSLMSEIDQNEIITYCKKEFPNVKIYKATLHEQKFELKKDLIV